MPQSTGYSLRDKTTKFHLNPRKLNLQVVLDWIVFSISHTSKILPKKSYPLVIHTLLLRI